MPSNIETKKISEIKPYEKNPRINKNAIAKVAESINAFGFQNPIIVDKNNVIITGHTRYAAAKKLGLKEIPCIVASNLTDEQANAYRIVDNKTSELSEWDFDLLNEEILNLPEFNFEEFGFEFFDEEEAHQEQKDAFQKRVRNIVNLEKAHFDGSGYFDIPQLKPVKPEEIQGIKEWIPFNMVLSDKDPTGKAVHFFIDDYQFERVWNNPEKYIEKLSKYICVAAPDFSPYGDMPNILQIYNHYRKHWVAKIFQDAGIKVIATIRASTDARSFDWYLEGEPKEGVVVISNMWTNTQEINNIFLKEYTTMYETLNPSKVFVYGSKETPGLPGNIEYIKSYARMHYEEKEDKDA